MMVGHPESSKLMEPCGAGQFLGKGGARERGGEKGTQADKNHVLLSVVLYVLSYLCIWSCSFDI